MSATKRSGAKRLEVLDEILDDMDRGLEVDPVDVATDDEPHDADVDDVDELEADDDEAEPDNDLGVAAGHLMNAFTELMLAFRHAMSAIPMRGAAGALDLESMRDRVRAEALEEIAQALRDEMKDVRRDGLKDPDAALARMTALAEVLCAVEKQADQARARAAEGDYPEEEETASDVARDWARQPRGDLKRVPLEVEEE